jgi:putative peptidoglycan lipid II flippase
MVGFSIVIVDEWIIKNQASYLAAGDLSFLQYGRTLMKVPIGVFGMAIGVAAYPSVSRMVASGGIPQAYGVLAHAVRLMLFATFAAQICLTLAGFEMTYLVWGLFASRFTLADAQDTGTILMFLCIGLAGWAAQTVISRGFYALGSTWLPTIVGTVVTAGLIPLYIVLRQNWGAVGLAVASSVSILIYVMLLGWLQRRRFEREAKAKGASLDHVPGMLDTALRLAAATAVAIAVGLVLRPTLIQLLPDNDDLAIVIRGTVLCAVGLGIYIALAWVLGVKELTEVEELAIRELRSRSHTS